MSRMRRKYCPKVPFAAASDKPRTTWFQAIMNATYLSRLGNRLVQCLYLDWVIVLRGDYEKRMKLLKYFRYAYDAPYENRELFNTGAMIRRLSRFSKKLFRSPGVNREYFLHDEYARRLYAFLGVPDEQVILVDFDEYAAEYKKQVLDFQNKYLNRTSTATELDYDTIREIFDEYLREEYSGNVPLVLILRSTGSIVRDIEGYTLDSCVVFGVSMDADARVECFAGITESETGKRYAIHPKGDKEELDWTSALPEGTLAVTAIYFNVDKLTRFRRASTAVGKKWLGEVQKGEIEDPKKLNDYLKVKLFGSLNM